MRCRRASLLAADVERRIDFSAFTDVERFRDHVNVLVADLKRLPRSEGVDEILVPGEWEDKTEEERSKTGIPLPDGTVQKLEVVAKRFGLAMPPLSL